MPTVVGYDADDATVRFRTNKDFSQSVALFRKEQKLPIRNVFVYVEQGILKDGTVNSPIAAYLRSRSFMDMVERNQAVADGVRCNPPIYTESTGRGDFSDQLLGEIADLSSFQDRAFADETAFR